MSATAAEIVAHIREHGGATVTLHGRHDIMGDKYDSPTYVVGGARDDSGEEVPEIVISPSAEALTEKDVEYVLRHLQYGTHKHEYVYTAAGFWVEPQLGRVVADLVNTTTLFQMAKQWAEEREQDAFYELVSGQVFYTDHYRQHLRDAELMEIREDLEAGWAQDIAEVTA